MRIQLLSLRNFQKPGGAITYCENVASQLTQRGHDVEGLCPSGNGDGKIGQRGALRYRTHPEPPSMKLAWRVPMLGYVRRFTPIVRSRCAESDLIVSFSLPYAAAAKQVFPDKPVVYACGGIQSLVSDMARGEKGPRPGILRTWNQSLFYKMERKTLLDVDTVLCLSRSYYERMVDWFKIAPDHWHVCPYGAEDFSKRMGADRESVRKRLNISDQTMVLVTVSVLDENKNTAALLDALARCQSNDVRLLVVGDGPQRGFLERKASELGIADRVIFVGYVQDPAPYLKAADAFALASKHEPFGLVYLEAMTCGLPVLGPKCTPDTYGVLGELIIDGESGMLFDRKDPAQIAGLVQQLADDRDRRFKMGNAARKRALEKFSWEKHVDFLLNTVQRSDTRAAAAIG